MKLTITHIVQFYILLLGPCAQQCLLTVPRKIPFIKGVHGYDKLQIWALILDGQERWHVLMEVSLAPDLGTLFPLDTYI